MASLAGDAKTAAASADGVADEAAPVSGLTAPPPPPGGPDEASDKEILS